MSEKTAIVHWPVLVRIGDDAELLTVGSAAQFADPQWRDTAGLRPITVEGGLNTGLEIIDSSGRVFNTAAKDSDTIEWHATKRIYSVEEVVRLVRCHAALQGHCCVAKIGARSIQDAVQMVEHLSDE